MISLSMGWKVWCTPYTLSYNVFLFFCFSNFDVHIFFCIVFFPAQHHTKPPRPSVSQTPCRWRIIYSRDGWREDVLCSESWRDLLCHVNPQLHSRRWHEPWGLLDVLFHNHKVLMSQDRTIELQLGCDSSSYRGCGAWVACQSLGPQRESDFNSRNIVYSVQMLHRWVLFEMLSCLWPVSFCEVYQFDIRK